MPSAQPSAEFARQPLEEPIRAELFGVERLEQHAESLAAAQHVMSESEKGRRLLPRVEDNGRVLREAYRVIAEAVREGRAIAPAAEWLVDNFHVVDEQLREIRDDLPIGKSSRISRSCSSTTWKLSTSHSAAGAIARPSRTASAITRYASRSTRPLSSTRGNSRRPFSDSLMTCWAAARLSACCSRRSTPKSSARIGSSSGCRANSAEGWALGIVVSEAKESGELLARTRDCSGNAKARQPLP